ncbi:unnamed protein product [Rotaria magnacalcarata]|uniref:Myb/SANT-like DNA-binding domain-containing protein n=1 Tax=Rotaria magnacalcarata TaxID=392030 RepID=A0A815R1V2_9BILA|nr:unnamed protein product [Rotaria magnacalcarata]
MNPQYIRVVFPSNKNLQVLVPSQNSILQSSPSSTFGQLLSNNQIRPVSQSSYASTSSPSDVEQISSRSSSNFEQQETQKTSLCTVQKSPCQVPSSTVDDVLQTQSIVQKKLMLSTGIVSSKAASSTLEPLSMKRDRSCSSDIKKNNSKLEPFIENEDHQTRKNKRAKNWSDEEISTFISVWSDYYDRLTTGGSRNMPIYNSMAQELNQLLAPRIMNGSDIKSKIFNLVSEYRKRKKEQGKTGGSPSTWRHFNQVDKLIGERPYNDDSLMSDTMTTQHDELLDDIEILSGNHLHDHSFIQESDHALDIVNDNEEIAKENQSLKSNSPCNMSCNEKNATKHTTDSSTKKVNVSRKKKISDVRIDLMQQLLTKIDGATEVANRAESKAFVLLEKQTKLQEESVNNEKEFLNVFKTIANNFSQTR